MFFSQATAYVSLFFLFPANTKCCSSGAACSANLFAGHPSDLVLNPLALSEPRFSRPVSNWGGRRVALCPAIGAGECRLTPNERGQESVALPQHRGRRATLCPKEGCRSFQLPSEGAGERRFVPSKGSGERRLFLKDCWGARANRPH